MISDSCLGACSMSHAFEQIDSNILIRETYLISFENDFKAKKADIAPKEKIQDSTAIEARTNSIKF